MNYKEINQAILEGRDIDEKLVTKSNDFYRYLRNNKVAYYYSSCLSKRATAEERAICEMGGIINSKYLRTLKLVRDICNREGIDFLLYKTHKYLPEVVDGDIDLFVHSIDFAKFMLVFEKAGFRVEEDEPSKGKCEKEGYSLIEPHISISWRGVSYLNEDILWKDTQRLVYPEGLEVKTVSLGVELISLLGKVYYEPAYLDLYSLGLLKNISEVKLSDEIYKIVEKRTGLSFLFRTALSPTILVSKLPFFVGTIPYLREWTRVFIQQRNLKTYLQHIVFYLYWRIRYRLVSKLPFTHLW